jgi:DNA-binding MarR family transcriptional regulator
VTRQSNQTAQRLLEVTMLLTRSLAAEMRREYQGITPMHVGLLAKIDAGEINMSELAQHLSVRLPTISKSVKLLVERGWVERRIPDENRRQTMVRLTRDGRRALAAMKRRAEGHVAGLLDPLTAGERKRVDSALICLGRALSAHVAPEHCGDGALRRE